MPKRDPTSELAALWCLKVLLNSDVRRQLSGRHGNGIDYRVAQTIGCAKLNGEIDPRKIARRAGARLREIERARRYALAPVLRSASRLARRLGLDDVQRDILALAAVCARDDGLQACFDEPSTRVAALATAMGRSRRDVRRALAPESVLRGGGLLSNVGCEFRVPDDVAEPLVDGVFSVSLITRQAARRSKGTSLSLDDFAHLADDVALARDLLRGALARRTRGVHVLFYGAPGTGKTELARVLADELDARLYEVTDSEDDGDAAGRLERLGKIALADHVLHKTSRSLLLLDEAEDALALSEAMIGRSRDTTRAKGWTHRMLEAVRMPVIWTANAVDDVDRATLRRFAFVLELPVPPQRTRQRLLASRLESLPVSREWIERASADERLSPAHIDQAARAVRLVGARSRERVEGTLSRLLDRNLAVQGAPRSSRMSSPCGAYEPAFVNASIDTESLVASLEKHPHASVCLYGPPGTGKTAYVTEVARRLGMPLHMKSASDLLSMWVGGTEKAIARMFQAATAERAVLFVDEADGLFHDRSTARASWQVTQVNELLVQMEAFDGLFFCATNMMENLDVASLRRFTLKIEFRALRREQRRAMFERLFDQRVNGLLDGMDDLTLGDFAAVVRQLRLVSNATTDEIVERLRREIALRRHGRSAKQIGF